MYLLLHIIIELSGNTHTHTCYLVNLFSSKWVVSGARHYKFCFLCFVLFCFFFLFVFFSGLFFGQVSYLPTVSRIYLPANSQGYFTVGTQREKRKRWIEYNPEGGRFGKHLCKKMHHIMTTGIPNVFSTSVQWYWYIILWVSTEIT